MNAFKSRRAYRDFLFENFGFHLTDVDWKDLDNWAKEDNGLSPDKEDRDFILQGEDPGEWMA